ncbi:MAG: hypothetical protein COB49_04835 [Alphaproteobacteria bacterium]|nr:MAG: hypothetical protein COB49_04835 [Alphaproteobacteria bacterium]
MTISSKEALSSLPNPYRNKTYTVSITQEITPGEQIFLFGLRYVPDKLLLDHDGLSEYLEQILTCRSAKTEILIHDILEDIMDQIIPKWIEVYLSQKQNKFGQNLLITVEDRQPGWKDDLMLSRLPAIF